MLLIMFTIFMLSRKIKFEYGLLSLLLLDDLILLILSYYFFGGVK